MSRKSLYLAILISLLLSALVGTGIVLLACHEPSFYERAEVPAGEYRTRCSGECFREFSNNLLGGILNGRAWDVRFTQDQVNSYFAEDLLTKHSVENPLPAGVRDLRVAFDADRIRFGFRYHWGLWSTVVSADLHVWLVAREPNMVALEFESLHAGALPISAHSLVEKVTDMAQEQNMGVDWYRRNGHSVLLLRFDNDKSSPRFQLQQLELRPGLLRVTGHSLESVRHLALGPNVVN